MAENIITIEEFKKQLPDNITRASVTLGGFLLGKFAMTQINKAIESNTVSGFLGELGLTDMAKKYASPVATVTLGAVVSMYGGNSKLNLNKYVGLGMSVAGAGVIVENVVGKQIIDGFTGLGEVEDFYADELTDEPTDVPPPVTLNLPQLSGEESFDEEDFDEEDFDEEDFDEEDIDEEDIDEEDIDEDIEYVEEFDSNIDA